MCRDAVAAPRALQLIVYPISLKKSLLFCEKIEKIKLFFFVKRSKAKIAQERKLFRMASQMPIRDFPRTGQSFAAAGIPDSRLEGLPEAKALFQHNTAGAKGQSILHCAACTLPCST